MKIAFFIFALDGIGGTSRSVVTQANALCLAGHSVEIVSATRTGETPRYHLDSRITRTYLVDERDPERPVALTGDLGRPNLAADLHARESLLVPARWDRQFTALVDAGSQAYLPGIDCDVFVTATPGLLATAIQLLPESPALVHQEHRSSSDRISGLEPLLAYLPRVDVAALLTPSMEEWISEALGPAAPELVVVPNPLPLGYKPRSTLEEKVIVVAGRLAGEKQFGQLIAAFAEIAAEIPDWRLRIFGIGGERPVLVRRVRQTGLYDRVELPGESRDMPSEWARASVSALTSRAEGLPLVVQEAMAAGVPVAAYDTPSGARELIEHDVNGLLVGADSVAGMASALLRLATDEPLRRRLGAGALASSSRYAAESIAERWVGIFERAIERRKRTPDGRLASRLVALHEATDPAPAEGAPPGDATPADARRLALSWVVDAARSASSDWFVIPPTGGTAAVVVLPMADRSDFLTRIGGPGAPTSLSLLDSAGFGWPERRGTLPTLAADLARGRTSSLTVEPWPTWEGEPTHLSQGCGVEVEFWERSPGGDLVAPRGNAYADRVPPATETVPLDVEGVVVRSLPLMARPTMATVRFPIDVVYTWVDGSDPAWDAERERRLSGLSGTARTRKASGAARFVNRDELRYSLRSLHLFAPWVRTVHLVTAGQIPAWLDPSHPRIRLVDHREILPADALPTFNSQAIETALHRVPDLAEHFLYLNDDFMLGRPLPPETFFTGAGQPAAFLFRHPIGLSDHPGAAPYLEAAWNNRRLIQQAFGVTITQQLAHAPYAHRRSVLEEICERFASEVAATARAPFRSEADVSLLSSLAQHYGLATGGAVAREADLSFVDLAHSRVRGQLRRLKDRDQDFICLGDSHDHGMRRDALAQLLAEWLEGYFPVSAPWEAS